eukprot:TRINITY_DN4689_c1_g1_i1.p1 TRINITY_DN4689_c1_g1~~TRINITY_DN4689_c1_g1_i1.p1  ORF type:complete len:268 (-),score=72.03 TRINITY_DN4689_c1_g1_i1:2-805(-)
MNKENLKVIEIEIKNKKLEINTLKQTNWFTIGARIWNCAKILIKLFIESSNKEENGNITEISIIHHFNNLNINFKQSKFLELGSGTGICGLTLAILGAYQVTLTDYFHQDILSLLQYNYQQNSHLFYNNNDNYSIVQIKSLNWGNIDIEDFNDKTIFNQQLSLYDEDWDWIIGSDLIYDDTESIEPLIWTLQRLIKNKIVIRNGIEKQIETKALFSVEIRSEISYFAFISKLQENFNLKMVLIEDKVINEICGCDNLKITIFLIESK